MPTSVAVAPEFDFKPHDGIRLRLKRLLQVFHSHVGNAVRGTPRSQISKLPEYAKPRAKTSRHLLSALVATPQTQELLQRCNVGHCQIDAPSDAAIFAVLPFPPAPSVTDGEVCIRVELQLLVAQPLPSPDFD